VPISTLAFRFAQRTSGESHGREVSGVEVASTSTGELEERDAFERHAMTSTSTPQGVGISFGVRSEVNPA
jgi:hypothetical protein